MENVTQKVNFQKIQLRLYNVTNFLEAKILTTKFQKIVNTIQKIINFFKNLAWLFYSVK